MESGAARFNNRVGTYLALMNDRYPSTDEPQWVQLEIPYPDTKRDLNRWLPLVKWLLAFPHYVVLIILYVAGVVVVIIAWFAILFTGRYPRGMFEFVDGCDPLDNRVVGYAWILVTDEYPPFSLDQRELHPRRLPSARSSGVARSGGVPSTGLAVPPRRRPRWRRRSSPS